MNHQIKYTDKPDYRSWLYLILPTFQWAKQEDSFNGSNQSTTEFSVNLFIFKLTSSDNYVIFELGLIVGFGLKIMYKIKGAE